MKITLKDGSIKEYVESKAIIDIAKDITGDEKVQIIDDSIMPIYECDCSKEKIERGLISLGKEELHLL